MALSIKKLVPHAIVPTVSNPGEDLGFDLYALEDVTVTPFTVHKIRTGIAATYSLRRSVYDHRIGNFGLLVRDRSSVALGGLFVVGGVIDAGYTGEILVLMRHFSRALIDVKAGQKIAQVIPMEVLTAEGVEEVWDLDESVRGNRGFGSTDLSHLPEGSH